MIALPLKDKFGRPLPRLDTSPATLARLAAMVRAANEARK